MKNREFNYKRPKRKLRPYGSVKGRNEYSSDDKALIPVVIKSRERKFKIEDYDNL